MAGKPGRSGRKCKKIEEIWDDVRISSQRILRRYLQNAMKMDDEELCKDGRVIQTCLQIELKERDIDSRRQVAQIHTAPLLELLDRARDDNNVIDVTPKGKLCAQIQDGIRADRSNIPNGINCNIDDTPGTPDTIDITPDDTPVA